MNIGKKAEFKDRLREGLQDCGLRPVDLVNRTGIPKSAVSYYLSGRSVPRADRIYEISQILGVSEAWLMGFDVPKTKTEEQKKNDAIVDVVSKLRKDPDFFDVVSLLAELPAEQYASVKTILSALTKK